MFDFIRRLFSGKKEEEQKKQQKQTATVKQPVQVPVQQVPKFTTSTLPQTSTSSQGVKSNLELMQGQGAGVLKTDEMNKRANELRQKNAAKEALQKKAVQVPSTPTILPDKNKQFIQQLEKQAAKQPQASKQSTTPVSVQSIPGYGAMTPEAQKQAVEKQKILNAPIKVQHDNFINDYLNPFGEKGLFGRQSVAKNTQIVENIANKGRNWVDNNIDPEHANGKLDSFGDVVRFAAGLPIGMVEAPLTSARDLREMTTGKRLNTDENGNIVGEEDLTGLQRAGAGANAFINTAGLAFGGSGTLLKSLAKRGGNEVAEQLIKDTGKRAFGEVAADVAKNIAKDALKEGAEEGVQSLASDLQENGQFDDGTVDRMLQNAALGAAGGGIMSGGGKVVTSIKNRALDIRHNDLLNSSSIYRQLNTELQTTSGRLEQEAISQRMSKLRSGVAQDGFIAGPLAGDFSRAQASGRVFEGVDGMPRFEVSDENMRIKNPEANTLGEMIDHPELFRNYPELADIKTRREYLEGVAGQFDRNTNALTINPQNDIKTQLGTVLHEIQHGIQKAEGWGGGTSPQAEVGRTIQAREAAEEARREFILANRDASGNIPEHLQPAFKQLNDNLSNAKNAEAMAHHTGGVDLYKRDANEAEARAVEARANMTDAERYVDVPQKVRLDDLQAVETGDKSVDWKFDQQKAPPIKIDQHGQIRDGHHRYFAAKDAFESDQKLYNEGRVDDVYMENKWGDVNFGEIDATIKNKPHLGEGWGVEKKRSTFDDSLDVPKEDLIVRQNESAPSRVMNIDPQKALETLKKFDDVLRGHRTQTILTRVSAELAQRIKAATGVDVRSGGRVVLDRSGAVHTMSTHGQGGKKTELQLTDTDIAKLPYVIEDPDRIIKGETKRGSERLRLERDMEGNKIAITEVIKKGNELRIVTYFNDSSSGRTSAALNASSLNDTSETGQLQSTNLDNSISNSAEKVKYPEVGRPPKNIHPQDQFKMAEFIDYARGIKKFGEKSAHELEVDAARIAERYGLEMPDSLKKLATVFDRKLAQTGYNGVAYSIDLEGAKYGKYKPEGEFIDLEPSDMEYIRQERSELLQDPSVRSYVDNEVASHKNSEEFLEGIVDRLWAENKAGKGVDTGLIKDASGDTRRWSESNNSKFYQDYYAEYGKKPTKRDIADMVRQSLDPSYGGVVKNVITEQTVPAVDSEVYLRLKQQGSNTDNGDNISGERAQFMKDQAENKARVQAMESSPEFQKQQKQKQQLRQVDEAIQRGFELGPRVTVDKIIDTTAELGFVPRKQVEQMVHEFASKNGYEIAAGRAFKDVRPEANSLVDSNGSLRSVEDIAPDAEILKKIKKPGVENAIPYGTEMPDVPARQMIYKNEDGTTGSFYQYRMPNGKWQKIGSDAAPIKSPSSKYVQDIKNNAALNAEAKRAYDEGTSSQYIWRQNDKGTGTEFITEWDAAIGDGVTNDGKKIADSSKLVGYDPSKHYIEGGRVVEADTGKVLGNYIEITPDGVRMAVGNKMMSLNYDEFDLEGLKKMKTSGTTWTMEGIIDRITGNRKRTNTIEYFKKGGHKLKEALMNVMVENPRAAIRNLTDESAALREAIDTYEQDFMGSLSRGNKKEAQQAAVYVIEPARVKSGEKITPYETRLDAFREEFGDAAASKLDGYAKFMRAVYDNLLVRVNRQRLAEGKPEIKRRNDYITHIGEMFDQGVLPNTIQTVRNMMGGDVVTDTRGALPARLVGRTEDFKPGGKYNQFAQTRLGDVKPENPFDPLRVYADVTLQNIHMNESIQMVRSLETMIRSLSEAKQEFKSPAGILSMQGRLERVFEGVQNGSVTKDDLTSMSKKLYGLNRAFRNLEGVDGLKRLLNKASKVEGDLPADLVTQIRNTVPVVDEQLTKLAEDTERLNGMKQQADGLGQFERIAQEHANKLAGKTNFHTRALKDGEMSVGTDLFIKGTKLAQQSAALSRIVGNLSSVVNQAMAIPSVTSTSSVGDMVRAFGVMQNKTVMNRSDAMHIRYKDGSLRKKGKFQKVMDTGGAPMEAVESRVAKWSWATKYSEAKQKGLNDLQATKYADRFVGDLMTFRDAASAPKAYDTLLGSSLLQFTREVTQQNRMWWNRMTKAQKVRQLVDMSIMVNILAAATGMKAGPDLLGYLWESGKDMLTPLDPDDEDDTAWKRAERIGKRTLSEVVSASPVASTVANQLPKDTRKDIFGDDSSLGRFDGSMAALGPLVDVVTAADHLKNGNTDNAWRSGVRALPLGSQLSKTGAAIQDNVRGYSITSTGKVKGTVDRNFWNLTGANVFGPNSFTNNNQNLITKQLGLSEANKGVSNKVNETFGEIQKSGGDGLAYLREAANYEKAKSASKKANAGGTIEAPSSLLSAEKQAEYNMKMRSGDWKEESGLVVNKGGEVQRNYYKELAKSSDTEDTDTYNNWMKAYNIDGASEKKKTATHTSSLLTSLENQEGQTDKAATAISFMKNADKYADMPEWVKERYYKEAGFNTEQVEYGAAASYSVTDKMNGYWSPLAESVSHEELVNTIYSGRKKSIGGQYLATTGIIDNLRKAGYLSTSEAKALKKVELDSSGAVSSQSSSSSSGSSGSSSKKSSKASSTTTSFKALVDAFEASQKSTVPETSKLTSSTTANTKKTMAKASLRKWSNAQNSKKPVKISIKKGIKTA